MATFDKKEILYASPALIPTIAEHIKNDFRSNGFDVMSDSLSSGGYDISISKGGMFKAILGMKTALKVTLLPQNNAISFDAGVGIWGQQAVPTVISMIFFWPVLITQIWGLIEQASLDDKALTIAKSVIEENGTAQPHAFTASKKFCTSCGTENPADAKFCCGCGSKL